MSQSRRAPQPFGQGQLRKDKVNMKEKRNLLTGVGLIRAFALWTVLIKCVDVRAVGRDGT